MRCRWPICIPAARALYAAYRTTARKRLSLTKALCEVRAMITQLASSDAGAAAAGLVVSARHGRPATMASRANTQ